MPALLLPFLLAAQTLAAPPKIACEKLRLLELNREPNLVIVDVRPPDAFAVSHIQGARNVPAKAVQTADLPRDAHIVVYCTEADCPLSSGAAQALINDGYPRVDLLEGGFGAWIQRGYPVQTKTAQVPRAQSPRVRAKDAAAQLASGGALALDTRPALEYAAGHIPGAMSLPLESLDAQLANVPKTKRILVYDRKAVRQRQALAKLIAAGYDAAELSGGIAGWKRGKRPLEVK